MSVINILVSARKAISDWRRREKAYGELMSLDDRSLSDIGIHRSQIPAIVEGFHHGGDVAEPVSANAKGPASIFSPRQARLAGGRWLPPV